MDKKTQFLCKIKKTMSFPSHYWTWTLMLAWSFTSVLHIINPGDCASLDRTMEPKAFGQDVVDAVIRKIRRSQVFTDDYDFMTRIAFVETNFGERKETFRNPNYYGGIWMVNEEEFLYTQDEQWKELHQKIWNAFQVRWTDVKWSDLLKPFYSGLAARLYLQTVTTNLPQTMGRQAVLWQKIYGKNDLRNNRDFVKEVTNFEASTLKCAGALDLTVVLDGSASVGESDFEISKTFMINLFSNYSASSVRLGFVVFGDEATLIFGLDSPLSLLEKLEMLKNVTYPSESTNTNAGILTAVEMINGSSPRPGVPSIMLVFTDGESNVGDGVSNIHLARKLNVNTFAVGIGPSINDTELLQIAYNDSSHMIIVNDYDTLKLDLAHRIFTETCLVSAKLALEEAYTGGLVQNENRFLALPITGKGLLVQKKILGNNGTGDGSEDPDELGQVDGYYSFTDPNPSEAVHDGKLDQYETIIKHPANGQGPAQIFISLIGRRKQNNFSFIALEGNDTINENDGLTTTTESNTTPDPNSTDKNNKVKEKQNERNRNKNGEAEFWNIGNFKRLPNGVAGSGQHQCQDNQVDFKQFPGRCELYTLCACGVKVLLSCAPGLYFDPSINACNFIQLVDCDNSAGRIIDNPLDS